MRPGCATTKRTWPTGAVRLARLQVVAGTARRAPRARSRGSRRSRSRAWPARRPCRRRAGRRPSIAHGWPSRIRTCTYEGPVSIPTARLALCASSNSAAPRSRAARIAVRDADAERRRRVQEPPGDAHREARARAGKPLTVYCRRRGTVSSDDRAGAGAASARSTSRRGARPSARTSVDAALGGAVRPACLRRRARRAGGRPARLPRSFVASRLSGSAPCALEGRAHAALVGDRAGGLDRQASANPSRSASCAVGRTAWSEPIVATATGSIPCSTRSPRTPPTSVKLLTIRCSASASSGASGEPSTTQTSCPSARAARSSPSCERDPPVRTNAWAIQAGAAALERIEQQAHALVERTSGRQPERSDALGRDPRHHLAGRRLDLHDQLLRRSGQLAGEPGDVGEQRPPGRRRRC